MPGCTCPLILASQTTLYSEYFAYQNRNSLSHFLALFVPSQIDSGSIIVSPVGTADYAYVAVDAGQLVVGPPDDPYDQGTDASFSYCNSNYMQTTQDSKSGLLNVAGSCVTVSPDDLSVALDVCPTADDETLANFFFVAVSTDAGDHYEFLGGPPGATQVLGFTVDDTDPRGLVAAVSGGGDVVLALLATTSG